MKILCKIWREWDKKKQKMREVIYSVNQLYSEGVASHTREIESYMPTWILPGTSIYSLLFKLSYSRPETRIFFNDSGKNFWYDLLPGLILFTLPSSLLAPQPPISIPKYSLLFFLHHTSQSNLDFHQTTQTMCPTLCNCTPRWQCCQVRSLLFPAPLVTAFCWLT
jgi:hypothetical protein